MDNKLINIENDLNQLKFTYDLNQIKFILKRLVLPKYKFIVDFKVYMVEDFSYFCVRVVCLVPEKHITLTNINNIINETKLVYNMMGFDYDVYISLNVN